MQPTLLCQRWREHRSLYKPARDVIDPNNYDVAPVAMSIAKDFCARHHYAGSSYPACRYRFGLFRKSQLAGVAVFSVPMSEKTLTNFFPGDPRDSVELGRFVLLDDVEANGESWFFARCKALLKREGLRGILAFADSTPRSDIHGNVVFSGHLGTVYAATGGTYRSKSTPRTLRLLPDATVLSPRAITKIRNRKRGWRYASKILVRHGAIEPTDTDDLKLWLDHWLPIITRPLRHPGNHRFLWSLQRNIVAIGTPLPYPKNFATVEEMEKHTNIFVSSAH